MYGRLCGGRVQYDSGRTEYSEYGCDWFRLDQYEVHVCMGRYLCGDGDSGADICRISAGFTGNVGQNIILCETAEWPLGVPLGILCETAEWR